MSVLKITWRRLAIIGTLCMLGACSQNSAQPTAAGTPSVASNPPPVAPGPKAVWYHVDFDTNSYGIDADGQKVIAEVMAYLQRNPGSVATIIGRTDAVGSADYNMHLSHRRADAVRDALVYPGNLAADRVETRWTGESRKAVAAANGGPGASNRVVDIAIH